ncbi:MAG: hypothetical protein K9J16_00405 [Melioribacteraceae bacterium]|nr:hypothetical protein [Melioribacteraceae bacterium]MCF8354053.1 hypothetical protein [Melioribacteraceae bacterium]MCF8393726.1 hypothetical protein [Melioribacteraceae bacterium]MCF8417750.1 hypothetical protein [Melioribacteraceae bacterium]
MTDLNSFINNEITYSLGWTLIHSLWQSAIIFLLLYVVLLFTDKRNPERRLRIASYSFVFQFVISAFTFAKLLQSNTNVMPEQAASLPASGIINIHSLNNFSGAESIVHKISIAPIVSAIDTYMPLIIVIYLSVLVFYTIKFCGGLYYIRRLRTNDIFEIDNRWKHKLEEIKSELDIGKNISLFESAKVMAPIVIGYLKPVILFPVGALTGLTAKQVETILIHELIHIKRNDYIINLIQSYLEIIFFFNPFMRIISSTIRKEREFICDDEVLKHAGDKLDYIKALTEFELNSAVNKNLQTALIKNKNQLLWRINRMLNQSKRDNASGRKALFSLITLIVFSAGILFACSSGNESANENLKMTTHQNESGNQETNSYSSKTETQPDSSQNEMTVIFWGKYEDEENHEWKAVYKDDELSALSKDDVRIPESELHKYESFVRKNITKENKHFDWDSRDFRVDLDGLEESLESLKDFKVHIDFDKTNMKRDLMKLNEELAQLKDIKIDIDLSELKENLADIKVDLADFEMPEIPEINIDMSELKESMKNLDLEMAELNVELKKLSAFLKEFKNELIADGMIEDEDDINTLEFNAKDMYINGEKVPKDLHKKYLELYKKHFGKYPDSDSGIHWHNDDEK